MDIIVLQLVHVYLTLQTVFGNLFNIPKVVKVIGIACRGRSRDNDAVLLLHFTAGIFVYEVAHLAPLFEALLRDQPRLPISIRHFDSESEFVFVFAVFAVPQPLQLALEAPEGGFDVTELAMLLVAKDSVA